MMSLLLVAKCFALLVLVSALGMYTANLFPHSESWVICLFTAVTANTEVGEAVFVMQPFAV